jgi:hypothetical protein
MGSEGHSLAYLLGIAGGLEERGLKPSPSATPGEAGCIETSSGAPQPPGRARAGGGGCGGWLMDQT